MRSRTEMSLRKATCFVLGFLVIALANTAFAGAPYDGLAPADSVVYVSVRDYPQMKAKFKQTRFYRMYQDPEVQVFLEKFVSKVREKVNQSSAAVGIAPEDIEKCFSGEVAFVLGEVSAAPPNVEFALIANVGNNQAAVKGIIDKLLKASAGQKVRISQEQFKGVTLFKIQKMKAAAANPGVDEAEGAPLGQPKPEQTVTYCIVDDTFIISGGTSSTLVQKLIDKKQGGPGKVLLSDPDYQLLLKKLDGASDVVTFVNFAKLLQLGEQAPLPIPVPLRTIYQELGIANMKGGGMSLQFKGDDVAARAFLHLPAPRTGIAKAFVAQNPQVIPPSYIPASCASYMVVYFDLPMFYQQLLNAVKAINPNSHAMVTAQLQMLAGDPNNPLNIEQNLINPFGAHIYMYQPAFKKGDVASPAFNMNFVIIWELKDGKKLETGLNALTKRFPNVNFQMEQVGGRTVHRMPLPMPTPDPAQQPVFNMVIFKNAMVMTFSNDLMKGFLDGMTSRKPGLKDDPTFKKLVQMLPKGPTMLSYSNEEVALKNFYAILETNPAVWDTTLGAKSMFSLMLGEEVFERAKLPKLSTLATYCRISGNAVVWTKDGAEMTTTSLPAK